MHRNPTLRLRSLVVLALVAPIVLGTVVVAAADEAAHEGAVCPLEQKLTALLADWEAAGAEAKAMSPAARQKLASTMAEVVGECPVGSRLGDTLVAVRNALGVVVTADEACAEECPLEKVAAAKAAAGDTECAAACAEMKALVTGRRKAIRALHALASHAAGFVSGGACCASARTSHTVATTATGAPPVCANPACAAASTCPIRVASRLGATQASWDIALTEAKALTAEQKTRLIDGIHAAAAQSKAVALVPASVAALAEGFDALDAVHGKMAAWVEANPELIKQVPDELHRSFQLQNALLAESREVLLRVRKTIAAVNPDCEAAAPSVETAAKR